MHNGRNDSLGRENEDYEQQTRLLLLVPTWEQLLIACEVNFHEEIWTKDNPQSKLLKILLNFLNFKLPVPVLMTSVYAERLSMWN